jgi:hypothetical protein
MGYPKEGSTSLYDYSDKSIPQAGYAAIVYALISTLSTGLAWFRAPGTPWIAIVIVAVVIGLFFNALAFGIFRKSRVALSSCLCSSSACSYTHGLSCDQAQAPFCPSSLRAFCCVALDAYFSITLSARWTRKRSNQAMQRTAGSHGKEDLRIMKDETAATRSPASRRSSCSR